ncbi:dTMP kinase [Candidatus Pantoea edessiphila]|uniref:Thymidylate kinase n=1 Tax=Candidatus Pantoea edessiphila TaxID=2044610 RepID=A0A2P5T2F3_9GAMM|nr:dTMP kinase [Candidatus Pantoea edessiphila]PPI88775.1 dTMP kinase [Candidatus Pantoea edessiphila]
MNNKFIAIEGLEGAGKTTVCNFIAKILKERGIKNENIIITREPGGTQIAEYLRHLIKKKTKERMLNKTELLIMYAARVQVVENIIKPALKSGKWVIGDRHNLSSKAYQGGGRQLGSKLINQLSHMILGDFHPDITFYLDITPDICLQRLKIRSDLDRIELESLKFFERTRNYYLKITKKDNNIVLIDATKSLNEVIQDLKFVLLKWIKKQ